jgi:N-acetyl-alpha-D-muramate 1-phosphate uridylyltransferase
VSGGGELLPVCILAGGRGTRLGDAAGDRPKPIVEVAGEPFLAHQLRLLARHGAQRIVLSVGYRGDLIAAALGDGTRYGVEITYVDDGPDLRGTAGAVRGCLAALGPRFLVLYGDTYLRIDYNAVQAAFEAAGTQALLTVLRNEGRWDTSNTVVEGDRVVAHDKRSPTPEMAWIDYGLGALHAGALDAAGPDEPDLNAVYRALAQVGELTAFVASERFYEIGSPAALAETDRFLRAATHG